MELNFYTAADTLLEHVLDLLVKKNFHKACYIFSAYMEILPLLHKMEKYKKTFWKDKS